MEMDDAARAYALARGICPVAPGRLPDDIPFGEHSFDLVVLFDVLEHLDDDAAALSAVAARLKGDGWLMVTVPAYNFLWSRRDELHHHKRRYTAGALRDIALQAGYRLHFLSYFNMWLLPLMVASRLVQQVTRSTCADGLNVPGKYLNSALTSLLASERFLMGSVSLPLGGSIIMVARKVS